MRLKGPPFGVKGLALVPLKVHNIESFGDMVFVILPVSHGRVILYIEHTIRRDAKRRGHACGDMARAAPHRHFALGDVGRDGDKGF